MSSVRATIRTNSELLVLPIFAVNQTISILQGGRAPSTTQYQKRSFDGTLKSPAQPGMKDDGLKVSALQSEILTNLSQAKSVSEQVAMLKDKVLAGEKHCNHVQQSIKQDLMSALQSDFHICELFTFGSMTTGLAFKDSDLDVYAHLGESIINILKFVNYKTINNSILQRK